MARFAPYEPCPHIAVAVSGGGDSMALTLLADAWARALGGRVTALTVDHRLRSASQAEADRVAAWMRTRGIAHTTLVRTGAAPRGDVQKSARDARYRLLEAWCAENHVLHLLTAHHREDQAETLLLRLGRGSGLDGLAGMPALVERAACRVLRPLLGIARDRLGATLAAQQQEWIEDPSNDDARYARVRLRRGSALLAEEGLTAERLAATAARLARARQALEPAIAATLARAAWLHPAGFAWLDPAPLLAGPDEVGLRALAAVIATVAGAAYPPRFVSLERLHAGLRSGLRTGRTLGGCRVLPRRHGCLLVCREPAAAEPAQYAAPGGTTLWDGRFVLDLPASAPEGLRLGALGDFIVDMDARSSAIPAAARATLPALFDHAGVWAIPHFGYARNSDIARATDGLRIAFRPALPLTPGGFTVV